MFIGHYLNNGCTGLQFAFNIKLISIKESILITGQSTVIFATIGCLLPYDPTWISSGDSVGRDVFIHQRVGSDCHVVSDGNAGQNDHIHTDPNIIADFHGLTNRPSIIIVNIMIGAD